MSSERADGKRRIETSLDAEQQAAFDRFWSQYPSRKSKAATVKAWAKLRPDADLQAAILAGLEASKQSEQWRRAIMPHASTWLNGACWEDEIASSCTVDELEVIKAYNAALGDQLGEVDAGVFSETRAACIRHFRALSGKSRRLNGAF